MPQVHVQLPGKYSHCEVAVPGPQFLLKTLLKAASLSWLFAEISLLSITEQSFVLVVLVLEIRLVVSSQESSAKVV
jgi:hypothetical protein